MNIPDKSYECPIQLRFVDTDMAGHVNHATLVSFLETARVEWIRDEAANTPMADIPIIIARVEVDYKQPILISSKPVVSMWISRVGTKSFDIDYAVFDAEQGKDQIYASARTVVVYFDYQQQKSKPIPDEIRILFEENMAK